MLSLFGSRAGLFNIDVGQSSNLYAGGVNQLRPLVLTGDVHIETNSCSALLAAIQVAAFCDMHSRLHGHLSFVIAAGTRLYQYK